MNRKLILASALCWAAFSFTACSDDESDILPGPPDYEKEEQPTKGAYIMTLEGKVDDGTEDGEYANMVYVDLSGQQQKLVGRTSWHLGFYCGDESRVTLNQSFSRAFSTKNTDFAMVSAADTVFVDAVKGDTVDIPDLAGGMMNFPKDQAITDATDGDLSKTVWGDLSSDANKSEVFLLATEGLKKESWFKVKVTVTEQGYLVEYGNINAVTAEKKHIEKSAHQDFIAFSLATGNVVELPQQWDLMWSKAIALTTMPNGKRILGPSSDVITTNRHGGVEVAEVSVNNPLHIREEFENFTKSGVESLQFSPNADILGTDWRLTPMPGAIAPGPKADRFYVFKDGAGKLFKVRFLHFCEEDGGERGKPMMEAAPLD